jgi:hypothetical protein
MVASTSINNRQHGVTNTVYSRLLTKYKSKMTNAVQQLNQSSAIFQVIHSKYAATRHKGLIWNFGQLKVKFRRSTATPNRQRSFSQIKGRQMFKLIHEYMNTNIEGSLTFGQSSPSNPV